jgi:iron(III) transport system permease protein
LALLTLALLGVVALPLLQLLDRSLFTDVNIAIFGLDDIRIGGHRVTVQGSRVETSDAAAEAPPPEAVEAHASEGRIERLAVRAVRVGSEWVRVSPIRIEVKDGAKGAGFFVDGGELAEDERQFTVERYIGPALFRQYFSDAVMYQSLWNSVYVASVSTVIGVFLAFVYAYALSHTRVRGKAVLRAIALLPLFAPTMLYALSLVYLFGRQGLITTGFFGHAPWLQADIGLYGPVGIILAEVIFTFPPAFIILSVALGAMDARLYDAARSLGAGRLRTFLTVTLPGARYGLMNAVFVCFTLAFTDFGAPKIVGGRDFNVLAVDIYKQVVGQQDFGMGATVSLILLAPAAAAFVAERILERRQTATLSSGSVPYVPKPSALGTGIATAACALIAAFILLILLTAGVTSLVRQWPYDIVFSLKHYRFEGVGAGYGNFFNSLRMAAYTAVLGTAVTFGGAYLVATARRSRLLRPLAYFLSVLPLALPGLVIGIAYIFFFNKPSFSIGSLELPNPASALYNTMAILVLSSVVHFYAVSFLTATTAIRQLDPNFEPVSETMGVPFYRTFARVTVPLCWPALFEIATYYFVSAMATVSAVMFLTSPDTEVASVAVVNMDEAGDTAAAAAMCMLIVLANIVVRGGFEGLRRFVLRRPGGGGASA